MSGPSIAMIVSPRRAAEEIAAARRLATALLAEGATLLLFEPEPERDPDATQPTQGRGERRFELPRRASYQVRVPFWLRRARIEQMLLACEQSAPELVWCCGADAWDLAVALGDELDRAVVLDFRRHDDLRLATRVIRNERVVALAAPCESLARAARALVPGPLVRLVPLGVRVPDVVGPADMREPSDALVITVLNERGDSAAVLAALRAVKAAAERWPQLLALVECDAHSDAYVWRTARTLGLLDRTTAVGRGPLSAAAVEACDLLLLPEPRGGPRCEALVALGRGVPIIAAADPHADTLIADDTAMLVPAGANHDRAWTEAVFAALAQHEAARARALRGRALVLQRHRSSLAAQACLAAASELLRGGPLRFSPTEVRR